MRLGFFFCFGFFFICYISNNKTDVTKRSDAAQGLRSVINWKKIIPTLGRGSLFTSGTDICMSTRVVT